ncbi:hypothetical protein KSS87_011633 [Heliosperma pusillum]|nr:hypothetical protein KSS87_011633 [Heliosperma pusillum]
MTKEVRTNKLNEQKAMGQVFSYIWKCIRPNKEADTPPTTLQNDQFTPPEQQSHYIAIPDGDTVQPEVYRKVPFILVNFENPIVKLDDQEEEEEEEEVVEKVIQVVIEKEVTSKVLARPIKEFDALRETVRRIGPYSSIQRILLVGEGFLTKNYSKFLTNKRELEIRGCIVIHGVDATNMIRHSLLGKLKFDRIIYNFPHTGCFGGSYTDLM